MGLIAKSPVRHNSQTDKKDTLLSAKLKQNKKNRLIGSQLVNLF